MMPQLSAFVENAASGKGGIGYGKAALEDYLL
jgi:hypothetical protein